MRFHSGVLVQFDSVDGNPSEFGIPVNAFHAVVADLFRVEIAAVAFPATDTFPVIQNAWTVHKRRPLIFDYTSSGKARSITYTTSEERMQWVQQF